MSLEDMVQTNVPVSSMLESNLPNLLDRCASTRHREIDASCVDGECMSRKAQQGIGAGSREDLLGDVCSGSDGSLLASAFQRAFNAAWPVCRSGCRPGDLLEFGDRITT